MRNCNNVRNRNTTRPVLILMRTIFNSISFVSLLIAHHNTNRNVQNDANKMLFIRGN